MKFHVVGADRNTGKKVAANVTASNRQAAERGLLAKGILIAELVEVAEATPPPPSPNVDPFAPQAMDHAPVEAAASDTIDMGANAQPLSYASPSANSPAPTRKRHAPKYEGITTGSSIISGLGIFLIVLGGLSIVLGLLIGAAVAVRSGSVGAGVFFTMWGFAWGVPILIWGFLFRWVAAMGIALRDIAQNSFRWV